MRILSQLHRPALKLAGLYLAILTTISIFFSINLYVVSLQEFDRGLRGPNQILQGPRGSIIPGQIRQELQAEREDIYQQTKDRLLLQLLLTNGVIAILGGCLSYYLALKTLRPIENAHKQLERFTADASHELRTPLAAMRSEIEVALMSNKLPAPKAKKLLQSNLEEIEKLTNLTNGLLQLAQMNSDGKKNEQSQIHQLVESAKQPLAPIAQDKKIAIKNTVKKDVIATINPDQIRQILTILLDNAIKYSPNDSAVTIGANITSKHLSILVSDQGVGVKASQLPFIFDRFYRADSSRSSNGYGIGLSLAQKLAQQQSGKITATSQVDKGSTFTLTVPL